MDWAEDLKSVLKVKSGLKRGKQQSIEDKSLEESSISKNEVAGQPRSRRFDGWASEVPKSSKTKTSPNLIEQERFLGRDVVSSPEEEIPTIPDLDDIHEEVVLNELAPNHSISMKMAATYKNLDSEMTKTFRALEDVDLTLLVRNLHKDVGEEPDVVWDWDTLFTEISAESVVDHDSISPNTTYLK